jgi:spermidine synthase
MQNIILICFFLSGCGGLVYESLWTRHLTHVIGGSPYAISIILSVFMGGLGLGGALGGRLADRLGRSGKPGDLLKAYGALELSIGAYALALPTLLSLVQPVFASAYRGLYGQPFLYNGIVFLLCALLLILPVLCMGATLPVIGKYCVRDADRVGGPLSFLYAVNTLGAAMGVLAAGFWLYPALGLRATTLCAAAVNAAVGIVSIFLGARRPGSGPAPATAPSGRAERPASRTGMETSFRMGFVPVLGVFGLTGFCAMAYEVIWTKVLTLIMGPTTYAFTLVLAVFITGLAAGGWAFGRIADRVRHPVRLLAATQGIAALLALAAGQRMGNGLFLFQAVDFRFQDGIGGSLAIKSAVLFLFMLAPCVFLGAAFPLVMRIAAKTGDRFGRSVGAAYAANTFGGVLGAWAAGFLLVPLMGSERSLGMLALLQAIGAALLAFAARRDAAGGAVRKAMAFSPALLVALLCAFYPHWDRHALSRAADLPDGETLSSVSWTDALFNRRPAVPPSLMAESQVYYGDGIGGFTSVWKSRNLLGSDEFSLFVSGKADASSRADMFTQVLLAQLPMLLHPDPKRVMVLGLASGVTSGEVLHYGVERLDVLEINPQGVQAAGFFKPWNGDVLADPRTRLILQDAKAHLLLSGAKYDVIISEPSNPWMAGLAELFTREFFERAKAGLDEGGMFVEFLHSYQMDWETFSMIGRTFAGVFPEGMLVRTMPDDRRLPGSASDYLLIGFKAAPGAPRPALRNGPERLAALSRSRNLRLADPRLLARLIEAENLPDLFGQGPVNTDDKPLLEFSAPRLRFTFDSRPIEAAIAARGSLRDSTRALRDSLAADPGARLGFAEYALSVYKPYPGMIVLPAGDSLGRRKIKEGLDRYCAEVQVADWDFLEDPDLRMSCSAVLMGVLNRSLKSGGSAAIYLAMGEVCLANGIADNAYKYFGKALDLSGGSSFVGQEARKRMDEIRILFRDASPAPVNSSP